MMVVVVTLTSLGIYIAQRRAAQEAEAGLQRDFELELASLHRLQDLRNAAVADRSKSLAQMPASTPRWKTMRSISFIRAREKSCAT